MMNSSEIVWGDSEMDPFYSLSLLNLKTENINIIFKS